jgi:hypothetical protein
VCVCVLFTYAHSFNHIGKLYIWGDCDIPQGCVAPPTHSHIIRMSGAVQEAPPPYHVAANPIGGGGMPPAYTPQGMLLFSTYICY